MTKDRAYYENLDLAISLLLTRFPEAINDYARLAELANQEFTLGEVTEEDIFKALEPNFMDEETDNRLRYSVLFNYNEQ